MASTCLGDGVEVVFGWDDPSMSWGWLGDGLGMAWDGLGMAWGRIGDGLGMGSSDSMNDGYILQ